MQEGAHPVGGGHEYYGGRSKNPFVHKSLVQGVFYSFLATVADVRSHPFQVHLQRPERPELVFSFCGDFVILFATALPLWYFAHQPILLPTPSAPSLVAGGFEMGRANKNQAYVSLSSEDWS